MQISVGPRNHALGTSATPQVGYCSLSATVATDYVLLWNGSASTVVDLNPPGFDVSYGYATNGMQQVGAGVGTFTTGNNRVGGGSQ